MAATRSGSSATTRRPAWALAVVVVAVGAVAAALIVGLMGLFANPVRSVSADGMTTLQGTFEPYRCDRTACDGYIQAGARSVFVRFPDACSPPMRGRYLTVTARRAADLGSGAYRALACPH